MKKITFLFAFIILLSWQGNAQITTYPYLEDFESGAGGWVANNTTSGTWALGTPANTIINSAASGANAWATNLTGLYNTNENSWVESPVFDFSALAAPSIQLSVWWNAEFSWDGMVLQSSIDGGTSWQNVGTVGDPNNWYTDNTINGNPGGQQEGWSGRNSTTNGSGGWVNASHPLTGLNGQSSVLLRLAFGSDGSVQDEGVAFDDINIFNVTCPQPSALSTVNVLATSADLGWTENGTATTWDIEWGTTGFAPTGTPTVAGTTTNPHNLTGLTANTAYDFYVRADCGGANGVSVWSGPFNFTTACTTMATPWLDDVEVHTATTNLNLSNCWSTTSVSAYDWNIDGAGSTPSGNTGPLGAFSGVNYFYVEASSGVAGDAAMLFSPNIDLTGLTVPVLEFYYHMTGAQMGNLFIDVWDGTTWVAVSSLLGEQQATQADPWIKSTINLSAFTGTIQIRFTARSGGTIEGDISLDNIGVKEAPLCIDPFALTATNITGTSADLGWTENGTATTWDIEWGTTGFAPTGTPTITGTITNPHNLTGLTAITTYDFYVRADCGGANGVSTWSGPFSFTTLCPASVPAPWLDDVEAHTATTALTASNCWTATAATGYDWNISGTGTTGSGGTGPLTAFSGTNFFYTEASGAGASDTALLLSPNIDLTALTVPLLEFYYHMTGAQMGTLFTDIWDGTNWIAVDSIIGEQQTAQADPWIKRSVSLSAFSGIIQTRFRAVSNGGFEGDISLDNINFRETPSCPDPTALAVTNVAGSSANLGWTEVGSAGTWQIEWGTTGFIQGVGTLVTTTTNPHLLIGLTPVTTYDFYVRSICAVGDSSVWTGPFSFTTTVACPSPIAQTATNVTATAVDLGWTEGGIATTWDIEWGATGFAPTGTPTITGTTTNPHNLTGLTANTAYDFYVRADCGGANGTSTWTGPFTFTTACNAMVAPWIDDVEAHATTTILTISNCWSATSVSGYDWNIDGAGSTPSSNTGPLGAFSGTNYFYTEASSGTVGDVAELNSPNIDLTALTVPLLEFYYHMTGNQMGSLFVDVWDGSVWTTVDSIIGEQQAAQADPWLRRIVNLSAFSGTIQLKFRAISNGTFEGDISLDDIEIKEAPSCIDPTGLAATNVIGSSADLSWIENGTATSWEIEWGTLGFPQGTGTLVLTSTNPHSLAGLTPVTAYSFYVRAVCAVGDSSVWAGPFAFTTTVSCPAPSAQTVTNITASTVDLGWTENGAATSWEIEWGTIGFPQGTGTLMLTSLNPQNITGLTDNTTYSFYVRAVCGVADSSLWTGPSNFTTDCNAMVAPWIDSVEAHAATTLLTISNCWSATSVSGYDWNIDGAGSTPSTATGPAGAFSGTNYFYVEASLGIAGDVAELFSPSIDITGLTIPSVEFYYHMFGNTSGEMGDLFIDIWDGSAWTTVDSIIGQQQTAQADPWLLKTVDISAFTGTIQVRFRAVSAGTFHGDISLDDIEVKESSVITCAASHTLTVTNITTSSADLGWTTVGATTTWELEWGTAGFVQGTGTSVITTTNPHNLTGLTANTMYDFYVRAICGAADSSAWSGLMSFATLCSVDLGLDTTVCSGNSLVLDAGAGNYTYIWSVNGTTTPNTAQTMTIDTTSLGGNGTYTIIATITDSITSCTASDTIVVDFSVCVGINEVNNNINLNVYPNPNNGVFTLNVNTTDINELNIKVMNVQGQVVFSKNNFDNISTVNEQIDLRNNANGIYFITVTSDKGVVTHKVIVQ